MTRSWMASISSISSTLNSGPKRAAHGLAAAAAVTALAVGAGGAFGTPGEAPEPATKVEGAAAMGGAVPDNAVPDNIVLPEPAPVYPAKHIAGYVGALQPNGWYCGPAATRIALSAHGILPSFDEIATALGTTRRGTDSVHDVTRALNMYFGYERYASVEMADRTVTDEDVQRLRWDVVRAISDGDVVVANIKGRVTDLAGEVHSYPGGHYVAVTGYFEDGAYVTVTDPADRRGSNEYNLPVETLAYWVATRGYSA